MPIEIIPDINEKKIIGAISIFSKARNADFKKSILSPITGLPWGSRNSYIAAKEMPNKAARKTWKVRFLNKS